MNRNWNGLDLQTELASLLGDTSTGFKLKVLGWMNDIIIDIASSYAWPDYRALGQTILTSGQEEQSLVMPSPGAPTIALDTGGSLTEDSAYKALITFVEGVSGVESQAGTASSEVTATSGSKTIDLSDIPVSANTLVTKRRVYLQKDGGDWLLSTEIEDNTTTTATITSEPSSAQRQPPDYSYIRILDGNPFFTSTANRQLKYEPIDQLRLVFEGNWNQGTPEWWSNITKERLLLYPVPSSALTLKYYYYRLPNQVYAVATDVPDLPIYLKPALYQGVKWKGYSYRERESADKQETRYESLKQQLYSIHGGSRRGSGRVRDVTGTNFWRTI